MADIYNPDYLSNRGFVNFMKQYGATSGRKLPLSLLDEIIQQELSNSNNRMIARKELELRQQTLAEQTRQFDISAEQREKERSTGAITGALGTGAQLGATYLTGKALGLWGTSAGATGQGVVGSAAPYYTASAPFTTNASMVPASLNASVPASAVGSTFATGATDAYGATLGATAIPKASAALATESAAATGATGATSGAVGSTMTAGAPVTAEAGTGLSATGALAYAAPAAAGYAAPKLVDAIHKDSMENIGHNLSLGLVRDEKSSKAFGSAATGAAAGAAIGSIVPGVGTAVGAVVGGIVGGLSSIFKW